MKINISKNFIFLILLFFMLSNIKIDFDFATSIDGPPTGYESQKNNQSSNQNYDNGTIYNYGTINNYNGYTDGYNNGYNYNSNNLWSIITYDYVPYYYSNNQPMITRHPIFAGPNDNLTFIANNLVKSAYDDINRYCYNERTNESEQDYFLNYASIINSTYYEINLSVNCAIKRKGVINGNIEFYLRLDLFNNRYHWKLRNDNSKKCTD